MEIDFKDKTDAELIQIIDASTYESKITNPMRIAAKTELHKRQSNIDKSTNTLTRWIFVLTLFIAILTCILLILQWWISFPLPKQPSAIQNLADTHDTTKDDKGKSQTKQETNNHKPSSQQVTAPDRQKPGVR